MEYIKNMFNFCIGILLGVVGYAMWQYDTFLYHTVYIVQVITLYLFINYPSNVKKKGKI